MDRATMHIIYKYLDGRLTNQERLDFEKKVVSKPDVQKEYIEMRLFYDLINASRPAAIKPPGNFRKKIMQKIKKMNSSSD